MIFPLITEQDRLSDFWMSEISANTLSVLTKFLWFFSLPKASAAIALFRIRLRNSKTCGHIQEDNLLSLFWQCSKTEGQISPKLIHYCSLSNILISFFTNYPKIRSYVVWNYKHGKCRHYGAWKLDCNTLYFFYVRVLVRIVHSSSCSDKVMSGFVAYVEYILLPYRWPLPPIWIYNHDLKFLFYMQQILFISKVCKQAAWQTRQIAYCKFRRR